MKLSVVTTLYNSASGLQEFYRKVKEEAEKLTRDYEIILVNDDSPDDSLQIAVSIHESDPRIKVIDLSRNFGHHKAIMTGLAYAQGELIFLIDSDLEEDPALLHTFHRSLLENEADVVFGVQDSRAGSLFRRVSGNLFYGLFRVMSDVKLPKNLLTVRLMTRRYVRSLVTHTERQLVISGLWVLTGFKQIPVIVHTRKDRRSSYTLGRKLTYVALAITGFSNKPLLYIALLGALLLFLSGLYLMYLLFVRLVFGRPPEGYTSLMVSIWFLGGLIIFSLGIIAIYLSVVFTETKNRPYTIIRHFYDRTPRQVS